ncbi:response regulator [Myxococcaceae bacterium GXIMD 01537]
MDLPFEAEEGVAGSQGPLAFAVLVVDDEPVVRDVVARLLAREPDLAITVAESAEEALPLLREQRFDVLVTDKNLPGMSGVELIAEARRLRPALEAMIITGYASSDSVIAAFAAGASDYLLKPFDDLRVVRAKVRAALERREERVKARERARSVARQAAALLEAGRDASEAAHDALETELSRYELAVKAGATTGCVAVVGSDAAVEVLKEEGLEAVGLPAEALALGHADVVVLETGHPHWREAAERLQSRPVDILLLASPQADLGDLLDAISLRFDLVGFGRADAARALPERVCTLLQRRSIISAQSRLACALDAFHASLRGPAR